MKGIALSPTGDETTKGVMVSLERSANTFVTEVAGQEMLPEYKQGDGLVFDPAVAPDPGDVVLAEIGGKVYLRMYRLISPGIQGEPVFELFPLNSKFPSFRSDQESVEIIATMMEQRLGRASLR